MSTEPRSRLERLTRADARGSDYIASEETIEIACAYALRQVRRLTRRLPRWMDREAFEEAVLDAVLRAAQNYDPSRGVSFYTHAVNRVRGAIMDEMRRQNRPEQKRVQNDTSAMSHTYHKTDQDVREILHDKNERYEHHQVIGEFLDLREQTDTRIDLRKILQEVAPLLLEPRELEFLLLHYLYQKSYEEIAALRGIHRTTVRCAVARAVQKLRAHVEGLA